MESANLIPLNVQEPRMVDLATLKNKIISTDLVLKKFHEKETECNQLLILKRGLENDCTTYERELKQVLEELLPAKKALEEYKKLNSTRGNRIKELEDDLKATAVISDQFCELAKAKEVENEELKCLKNIQKDLKKKDKQLEKSRLSNKKLLDETKITQRKLNNLKKSYTKCLKTLINITDKVGTNKNLTKGDSKRIKQYKRILNASHPNEALETELNLLEGECDDEEDEGSKLEKLLQGDGATPTSSFLSDDENNDIVPMEPEKSAIKTPTKTSLKNLEEMITKKRDSPPCLEHHSYSLMSSPRKRKSSLSSPVKTDSTIIGNCSFDILKKASLPPIILTNGISNSVTIGDSDEKEHHIDDLLLLPQEEIISQTLKTDFSRSCLSAVEEGIIVPVDPNASDVEAQIDIEDVTINPISLKILAQIKLNETKNKKLKINFDDTKSIEKKFGESKFSVFQNKADESKTEQLHVKVDQGKNDHLTVKDDEAKTNHLTVKNDEGKTNHLTFKNYEGKTDHLTVKDDKGKTDQLLVKVNEGKIDQLLAKVDYDEGKTKELQANECKIIKDKNDTRFIELSPQNFSKPSMVNIKNSFEVNVSPEIHETVEYIIVNVCSIDGSLLNKESINELDISCLKCSTVGSELPSRNDRGKTQSESSTINVTELTDSVFVEESVTVNKTVDDEIKTTLRRVRRMTNRLSLSAMFERPISPLPPSPLLSPSESMFESMIEGSLLEEQTAIAPVDDLDELFGTDSEDENLIVPPKPFQHQESQGFDAEFASEELRPPPNPIVERLKRSAIVTTKDKLSSLASSSSQPVQHYSSDQDSHYSPRHREMDNEASDFTSNESEPPETHHAPTSNHTETVNNPPCGNSSQSRLSRTTGFNSKLKANFSHNSDTGNYSISICLPDSTNPVKNLHFEIDTLSNEFTLNFGPGSHQPLEPSLALNSPQKNISQSARKRTSPFRDSCYDSTFNSSKTTTLNSTPVNARSSGSKKGKKSTTNEDVSPSLPNRNSEETKSTLENKSNKPSFLKSSASAKALPKFLPCNNSFINPRKQTDKEYNPPPSKSLHLQDKAPSIPLKKRPLLKLRKVSIESGNNLTPSNEIEPSFEPPSSIEPEEILSGIIQQRESKDTSKTVLKHSSKTNKSTTALEPEIPILQPMVNKRISHLNLNKNGNKEMPVLTKKVKPDTTVPLSIPTKPLTGQKRKVESEHNEKNLSADSIPSLKKQCIENDLNDEMKMVRKFWMMFETPLEESLEIQAILNEFKMSYETEASDKEETIKNIFNKLANPTIVSSSKSLIDAILSISIKSKRNPFTGSNKLEYPVDYEKELVATLFYLSEKEVLFKNLITGFKDRANSYLFVIHHKYLNGLGEITRLLSLICKQEGDTQIPRMLCCNMMKDRPNISVFITGNVAISWPQVLAPNNDKINLAQDTFVKIILTQFTNESATLKRKAGLAIKKCCQVNIDKPHHTFNVTESMKDLVHVYIEPKATDDELSEANLGLELLAWYKTWSWTINYLIKNQLLPLFDLTNIRDKNLTYLVQLLGLLIKNSKTKNKKEVSHTIKAFFKILMEQKSEELRDSALFNILHLKNYLDCSQIKNLKKWIKSHQTLDSKFLINKLPVIESNQS